MQPSLPALMTPPQRQRHNCAPKKTFATLSVFTPLREILSLSLMQSLPDLYDFLTTRILPLLQEAPPSARHYLPRRRAALLRRLLAAHQSLRKVINNMDYILAGITALFLFCYLIYALLKPEKF